MDSTCETCHGRGDFDRGGRLVECRCQVIKRACASMPHHIRVADIMPAHLAFGLHRVADRCLFIRSAWADMKPVIKACMFHWFEKKVVRVTSDREIRDVYVGSKSKAMAKDDEQVVFNNLQDLMEPIAEKPGARPVMGAPKKDLVIVRLNELSYKNKAAPGALEEALQIRTDRDRPTWVVSDLDKPFGPGSHAFSESVWDLLTSSVFRGVDIPRITPRGGIQLQLQPARPTAFQAPAPSPVAPSLVASAPPRAQAPAPEPEPEAPAPPREEGPSRRTFKSASDDAPFSIGSIGQGIKSRKKFGGRS